MPNAVWVWDIMKMKLAATLVQTHPIKCELNNFEGRTLFTQG